MDEKAALELIEEALLQTQATIDIERHLHGDGYWDTRAWKEANAWLEAHLVGLRRVVSSLNTELGEMIAPNLGMYERTWGVADRGLQRAAGQLRTSERIEGILAAVGPVLAASGLHPWVWEPAAPLWDKGHRREAIQAAATRLDTEVQAKLERWDISGTDLAKQAWSDDAPQPDRPRLRPAGHTPGTESFKAALGGARSLHQGVMMGIRNRATHDLAQPDEQVALEQLAALSVVSRWVEEADVEQV